jgi:hypothetical protein
MKAEKFDRSYEDFVEEMLDRGRTEKQIFAVMLATRWWEYRDEIVEYLERLRKIFGK